MGKRKKMAQDYNTQHSSHRNGVQIHKYRSTVCSIKFGSWRVKEIKVKGGYSKDKILANVTENIIHGILQKELKSKVKNYEWTE